MRVNLLGLMIDDTGISLLIVTDSGRARSIRTSLKWMLNGVKVVKGGGSN